MLARRPTDDRDVGVEPTLDELAVLLTEALLLLRRTGDVGVLGGAGPSSVGASSPASPLPRFIAATLYRPRLLCWGHGQTSTPVRVRALCSLAGTWERWLLLPKHNSSTKAVQKPGRVPLPSYRRLGQRGSEGGSNQPLCLV